MDYFTDVYLKRVNKHGTDLQSRIHGKMECDFENKLAKSVNRVEMFDYTDDKRQIGVGILESKKINETEVVDYLLTRIKDNYENGFVFYTLKPFSLEKQAWMILYKEQYETIGYNRYIAVLLENTIEWIGRDGLLYSSPVHYVGSKDGKIKSNFKISYEVAVNTPSKTLAMICPQNKAISRNMKFNISDETWNVSGYDKISVPGVMYVTLEEDYVQKSQYANQHELEKWSLTSVQGDEIVVTLGKDNAIDFYCSYDGANVDEDIDLTSNNKDLTITRTNFNQYKFNGIAGTYTVTARLARNSLVSTEFNVTVVETEENWMAIVGPNQLKVLQTLEYTLNSSLTDYAINITSQNGCFTIDKIDGNKVYLKGINIGQDYILITYEGNTYSTPLNVISPWM